jgi:glutathione S-transferase
MCHANALVSKQWEDAMKPLKLFEFAPTRSIRVRWTLQELSVPFEAITIDLTAGDHRRPEFLKINPAGKLPVLIDGDMVLTESIAIVLYLAEKYPERGLNPSDIRQRAQLNRWLLFTTTELEQPLWRIRRHKTIYPRDKRLPGEVALACDEFAAMARVLEEHMRGRKFVVGDTVTVGDFVLAYTLDWAKMANLLNGLPQLEAYMEQMYARPHAPMPIAEALALSGLGRETTLPSDTVVPEVLSLPAKPNAQP